MNEGMSQMLQMMFQPYFAPITVALIHFSGTRIISTHITTIQSHINTSRALFQLPPPVLLLQSLNPLLLPVSTSWCTLFDTFIRTY